VTGELVAADVASLTCLVDFAKKFSVHWAPCWVSWHRSWVLCFIVEGDSSCALVLPPCILPSSSMCIGGLESGNACEVLGVVDELLMNPINIHVDRSSHLINGCSD
jgi:hypothetical protein